MTIGLRVWRPDTGALILDTTTSMTRVLGTATTVAGQAGQLSHAGFATGTGFFVVLNTRAITSDDSFPDVELINNQTITWDAVTMPVVIIYGVRS